MTQRLTLASTDATLDTASRKRPKSAPNRSSGDKNESKRKGIPGVRSKAAAPIFQATFHAFCSASPRLVLERTPLLSAAL
jgi:hypothetical protein